MKNKFKLFSVSFVSPREIDGGFSTPLYNGRGGFEMPARSDFDCELQTRLDGATGIAVLGVGYELGRDDGAGLLSAAEVHRRCPGIMVHLTGSAPESFTGPVVKTRPSHVVFIDAAQMGLAPGSLACLDREDIGGACFSTHTLPLSTVMEYFALTIGAKSFVIGIQPRYEGFGEHISPEVRSAAAKVAKAMARAAAKLNPRT